MTSAVQRVVIVGTDASAWLSASALKRAFRHRNLDVIVLDIGRSDTQLAMWTLPSLRGLHGLIGIREPDLIQRTGATFKLASEHTDWQGEGSCFLHAHGEIGSALNGTPFYKYLLLRRICGGFERAEDYSLAAVAARTRRFARPTAHNELTSSFNYGLHLDAAEYTAYLCGQAERLGVQRVEGGFADVSLGKDGRVAAVLLEGGERLEADYFLDCSGREALLMNRILPTEREDWSEWLPNDRILSMRAPAIEEPAPVTQTIADRAGWLWRVPLAQTSIAGYVYSSAFVSDDEALDRVTNARADRSEERALMQIRQGRRKACWVRNCIAIGEAAVELEPLVGANLHLVQLGIAAFIDLFPIDQGGALEALEYNRMMGEHADALRDFTIAHYRAGRSARTGEYWAAIRAAALPNRLAGKLNLYRASGRINLLDNETFEEVDWAWLLLGSGCVPEAIELHLQANLERAQPQHFATLRTSIEKSASSMFRHIDYVRYQR